MERSTKIQPAEQPKEATVMHMGNTPKEEKLKHIIVEVPSTTETTGTTGLQRHYTVFDILTNLGLHDYVSVFEQKGYDDTQDLQFMTEEDWKTLVTDTALKPRHAVRLKRRLEQIAIEGERPEEETVPERTTEYLKDWNVTQVWKWLSSKPYSEKLNKSAWEFTDGATLLELNVESAEELEIPPILIPRVLTDIKSKARESDCVPILSASALAEHSEQMTDLENRLSAMDYRDRVKNYDKEFGSSLIRVTIVMAITYAVLSVYMLLINVDRPFTGAIIPTIGFQLSTLSLPSIRACYVERRLTNVKK